MARRPRRRGSAPQPAPTGSSVNIVQVVGLSELFALPLTALVDADVYGSQAFLAFLKEFAFEPTGDGNGDDYGRLRTVTFYYTANGSMGSTQQMKVEVPWISLVPLPLLSIKDAHMEFEVEVVGVTETTTTNGVEDARERLEKTDNVKKASAQQRQFQVRLMRSSQSAVPVTAQTTSPGRVSGNARASASGETTTTASEEVRSRVNMHVQMNMGQSDLPAGIIQLLNLTQQGTMEQSLTGPVLTLRTADGRVVMSAEGEVIEVVARLVDEKGYPIKGAHVRLSQDRDPYFTPERAVARTNANGEAHATFQLTKLPKEQPVLKSIFALTVVETPSFKQADISATLNIEILPDAASGT